MSKVQTYVHATLEQANKCLACANDQRFRVYKCPVVQTVTGKFVYVVERTPTVALGRTAEHSNISAQPITEVQMTTDVLLSMLEQMSDAERLNILNKYTK